MAWHHWNDDVINNFHISSKANVLSYVSTERSDQILSNYTILEHVRVMKIVVIATLVLTITVIDVIKNDTFEQNSKCIQMKSRIKSYVMQALLHC